MDSTQNKVVDPYALAAQTAETFNLTHAGTFLKVVKHHDPVTEVELRALARTPLHDQLAAEIFLRIRRRSPTHSEAVKLGQLLATLRVPARKVGPCRFYDLGALDRTPPTDAD